MKDHIKIEMEVPRADAYLICGISNIPGKDKIFVGFHHEGDFPDDLSFEKAVLDAMALEILYLQEKQKERHHAEKTGSDRLTDLGL